MIENNELVTNPALKEAMQNVLLQYTDKADQEFREELKKARLLAPVKVSDDFPRENKGQITLEKSQTFSFLCSKNKEGDPLFPVFTDWEELSTWTGGQKTDALVITLEDYHAMICQADSKVIGISLNPASSGILLTKEQIAFMLGKSVPMKMQKETKVTLGEPAEYPTELTDAVTDFCKKQKNIRRVWLQLMYQNEEKSFLLVVDFEKADKKEIFDQIATAAKPHLNGMYLDMVPFTSELGQKATKNVSPFYEKKRFSFFGK